jgi:hypothetical protein
VAKPFSGRRFFAASLAGAASIVIFPSGACLRTERLFVGRDSRLAGSFPTGKKTNPHNSAAVICGAAKASGNGHGAYFGDGFGDRADPHGGFLFGGRLAAYGVGNEPFGGRVRIDRRDSLDDETQWEEDHREGVERLHVPELERERLLLRRESSSG